MNISLLKCADWEHKAYKQQHLKESEQLLEHLHISTYWCQCWVHLCLCCFFSLPMMELWTDNFWDLPAQRSKLNTHDVAVRRGNQEDGQETDDQTGSLCVDVELLCVDSLCGRLEKRSWMMPRSVWLCSPM